MKTDRESCDERSENDGKEVELVINGRVVATFPNTMIALRLCLTLPCGVALG